MNTNIYLTTLLAALLATFTPPGAYANPGDLYVTDNSSIRRYEPNGTEHVFSTGLLRARGLAFDGTGNLFVATLDTAIRGDNRGQILKFTPDGIATVFAAGAGLKSPEGLAFDGAGNLWVTSNYFSAGVFHAPFGNPGPLANAGEGRVTEITPSGERTVLHLDPTTYHQNFGIAFDGQNNLGVADNLQSGIYKIAPDRRITILISASDPIGLAFDGTGNLLVSNIEGDITKIAPDGNQTLVVSGLGELRGLAIDKDCNIFAASPFFAPDGDGHDVIYKILPDGSVSVFANGLDAPQFLAVEP